MAWRNRQCVGFLWRSLSPFLSVSLPVIVSLLLYLSVSLTVCHCLSCSISLSLSLSPCHCLSLTLSQSLSLSVIVSLILSLSHCLYVIVSFSLSLYLAVCLSHCLSLPLSCSISLSLSLSHCLSLPLSFFTWFRHPSIPYSWDTIPHVYSSQWITTLFINQVKSDWDLMTIPVCMMKPSLPSQLAELKLDIISSPNYFLVRM